MPRTWQASIPTLFGTGRGMGCSALRPVGLVSVLLRAAARCTLKAIGEDTLPQKVNGYAYRKPIRLVIEEGMAWGGEPLHILQLDLSDAFGCADYWFVWDAASKEVGKRHALSLVRLLLGTSFNLRWAGHTDSAENGMRRGGRQGIVETPPCGRFIWSMQRPRFWAGGLKEGGGSWSLRPRWERTGEGMTPSHL